MSNKRLIANIERKAQRYAQASDKLRLQKAAAQAAVKADFQVKGAAAVMREIETTQASLRTAIGTAANARAELMAALDSLVQSKRREL